MERLWWLYSKLFFVVITIFVRTQTTSFNLSFNLLHSPNPSEYQLSFISSNRYCVSFHSFNAIFILDKKSLLLCASSASTLFAQILVPLLNICLLRTNSLLAFKCLYSHIISILKLIHSFVISYFFSIPSDYKLKPTIIFPFSIFQFFHSY